MLAVLLPPFESIPCWHCLCSVRSCYVSTYQATQRKLSIGVRHRAGCDHVGRLTLTCPIAGSVSPWVRPCWPSYALHWQHCLMDWQVPFTPIQNVGQPDLKPMVSDTSDWLRLVWNPLHVRTPWKKAGSDWSGIVRFCRTRYRGAMGTGWVKLT